MSRVRFWAVLGLFGTVCLFVPVAQSQPGGGVVIKGKAAPPEPIADTKLLMQGLASTNLRGLGKLLREKPTEAEAWTFARGQALIIAETGNLLLIRPPRTGSGADLWLGHAGDMRDAADKLARAAVAKDYAKSRAGLANLANVCNRCHQSFQVPTRVDPFADE
ncbi:MAG: hypothetical protein K8U57_24735 [Planctomycetes bacterium]|nr:hypothetical protein [Planctomycetota bacterium]